MWNNIDIYVFQFFKNQKKRACRICIFLMNLVKNQKYSSFELDLQSLWFLWSNQMQKRKKKNWIYEFEARVEPKFTVVAETSN